MQSPLPDDVLISILSKNSFLQVVQLYRANQRYQQLLENKDVLHQLTEIYRQEIVRDDTLGDKQSIAWNIYPQTFAEYTELIRKERYDTLECDRYHDVLPCIMSAVQRDDYNIFLQLIMRKWKSLTYAEKEKCLTEIIKFDRANFLEALLERGVKAGRALVEVVIEYNAPKTLALLLQRVSMEKDPLLERIKLALRSSAEEALQVLLKNNSVVDEEMAEEIMSMLEQWPLNNAKSMAMAKALLEFLTPVIVQGSILTLNKFLEIALYNKTLAAVLSNRALLDRLPETNLEENTITDLLPVLVQEDRYDILKQILGDVFYGDAKSYGDWLSVAIEKEDWELLKLLQGMRFETDWSRLYASLHFQKSLPKGNRDMFNAVLDWTLDQAFVPEQTPIMFIVFLLALQRVQDADDLMSLFSVSNREKAEILREYKQLVQ